MYHLLNRAVARARIFAKARAAVRPVAGERSGVGGVAAIRSGRDASIRAKPRQERTAKRLGLECTLRGHGRPRKHPPADDPI